MKDVKGSRICDELKNYEKDRPVLMTRIRKRQVYDRKDFYDLKGGEHN